MEFKLVSFKQRNIIIRIFSIYNYQAVVKYNNKEYKLNIYVRKDLDSKGILRIINWKLEEQLARDTFNLTLEDLDSYIGSTITDEYYKY